ncbi:hypothetical protein EZV62_014857 [Acer yangbiense]|uniref:Uncharacterized protein n=1 Tax=Acer yangbiense TaxID=1000413 RepID=A0A5C7HU03_9ROSI|nr:hypothetical protein EZV62_014857 [Acer yangbiense]
MIIIIIIFYLQQLDNLKRINLSMSRHLIRCPNLSGAQNLERLMLGNCTSLSEIPDCSSLKSLKELDLYRCKKLKRIPELPNNLETLGLSYCSSLVEFPSSFKHLNKVEFLNFSSCKSLTSIPDLRAFKSLNDLLICCCPNFKMLPEVTKNITWLDLSDAQLEELPLSLKDLDSLKHLNLNGCSMLKSLPRSVCNWKSLEFLYLNDCSKIDKLPDDIGTLESLECIQARGTAVRELPPSISCLKRLNSLDFSGCKGENGEGLLLPPLSGLENLEYLYLSDCGITALPETLGCLTSLEKLHLGRNDFESIPGSIINLSQLHILDISYCERLRVLPELHVGTCIKAVTCTSLEVLSYFSFKNEDFQLDANFINCFKLDRNALNDVVKDTLQKIQGPAAALVKKSNHQKVYKGVSPYAHMKYPGSEIPEWFSYRSRGSCIDVELPPSWLDYNFLCFALCIVVANPDLDNQCDHDRDIDRRYSKVNYECNVKSKDGDQPVETERLCGNHYSLFGDPYSLFEVPHSTPDHIRSNHVIIGFGYHFFRDLCDNKFSFQFYDKVFKPEYVFTSRYHMEKNELYVDENELNIEFCKVEECGVHLMFGQHLETSDEGEEEDEKLLEESNEEDESRLEESGEEAEPHPKRLKHIE